ncbi:MAG: DUF1549 domain-containing protein [Planctomycetia bacterium]|nr:DUF1549 domain-containing protein [Planctomycetia bacterium]
MRRDLLFLVISISALLAFKASVFPSAGSRPRPAVRVDMASLQPAVERVDAAFEQLWRERNLKPAKAAPELAVARRISLALTGAIPSLEEIRHFESLPPPQRLERWLAERLADRRYADFVAERLARAFVGVDDGPFLLFRRRRFVSWLADQLSTNQRYDRIVAHLIADSGIWTDTPATNFITVTIQPDQNKGPDANRLAARVSRAFLGVRLDCAECHDHPFESWTQHDFQSLAAFFGSTRHSLRGVRDVPGDYQIENRLTGEMETIPCGVPFSRDLLSDKGSPRRNLAAWVTHRENRPFAREAVNRAWALLFGRPLVEPIDNMSIGGPFPPALEILAEDFVNHGYDWQRLLLEIASTKVFRADSKTHQSESSDDTQNVVGTAASWAVFPLTRLRPEQVVGALLQSASLSTIDSSSHIIVRLAREIGQRDFIKQYGDSGAEEFDAHGGTIPQRLLMMNGKIVDEKTKEALLSNAATQIAAFAPNDHKAVETAMLAVLTRRPSNEEQNYFTQRLAQTEGGQRARRVGDLVWTLLNSTEFSWNH